MEAMGRCGSPLVAPTCRKPWGRCGFPTVLDIKTLGTWLWTLATARALARVLDILFRYVAWALVSSLTRLSTALEDRIQGGLLPIYPHTMTASAQEAIRPVQQFSVIMSHTARVCLQYGLSPNPALLPPAGDGVDSSRHSGSSSCPPPCRLLPSAATSRRSFRTRCVLTAEAPPDPLALHDDSPPRESHWVVRCPGSRPSSRLPGWF
jgi:hypothetical protein